MYLEIGTVRADIAMAVRPVVLEVTDSEPTPVGVCLRHPDKVPDGTKVPGEMVRYSDMYGTAKEGDGYSAQIVGWIKYGGSMAVEVVPGSLVQRMKWSLKGPKLDDREYIVDTFDGEWVNLLFDDRLRTARVKCLTKQIVRHGVRWEKVFSIQAPCITVWSLP